MSLTQDEIDGLSPGVRDLVIWLNAIGFQTTDSGDGSNFAAGMECAIEEPMVAIQVDPKELITESERLLVELGKRGVAFTHEYSEGAKVIQANYNPLDRIAMIVLFNVLSSDLQPLRHQ